MAKKRKDTKKEYSEEVYNSNIEQVDIADYTMDKVFRYGVNVCVARACASLDDGLNRVRRRIIWNMYNDHKLLPNGRFVKVPEFLFQTARYHPHGNQSIEKTFGNMIKPWESNALLISVDNNSGSLTGDASAAVRYLDAKLSVYCYKCFFEEFDETIIDMVPNYINTCKEPVVLPSKYPNFLVSLTTGIAWGNTIDIPPFNLEEAFRLTQALLENPDMTKVYLFPDSPRGYDVIDDGTILDVCESRTGGTVKIRAVIEYVEDGNYLTVTGFPEQTTMDKIIKQIHDLIKSKSIIGIVDIADKSDINVTEFWIYLKKDANPYEIRDILYKKTSLEGTANVSFNFADRTKMTPMNLKEAILEWIDRRIDVKQRYYIKKLSDTKERKVKLSALVDILSDRGKLNKAIDLIEKSEEDSDIIQQLREDMGYNSLQAGLISDMSLKQKSKSRLEKYKQELEEIDGKITEIESLVRSKQKIKDKIYEELEEGIKLFGKPRNCRVVKASELKKHVVHFRLVITKKYVKKLSINGKVIGYVDSDDEVIAYYPDVTEDSDIYIADTLGKFYRLNLSKVPSNDVVNKGTELISLGVKGDVVRAMNISPEMKAEDYIENCSMVVFTTSGIIKASPLSQYTKARGEIQGILLNPDDEVCYACIYDKSKPETRQKLIYTKNGMGIVIDLDSVNETDRLTKGLRHLKLDDDVIKGICDSDGVDEMYVITEKGYGKRCNLDDILTASKRKDNMARLTGLNDGDSVFKILPVTEDTEKSTIVFHMQSGEKKEILCSDIEKTTRISKGKKLIGVRRGDAIVKIKIN